MCDDLQLGDRVYYTDNGPDDTGTVGNVDFGSERTYGVVWDDGSNSDDAYLRHQLTRVDC